MLHNEGEAAMTKEVGFTIATGMETNVKLRKKIVSQIYGA